MSWSVSLCPSPCHCHGPGPAHCHVSPDLLRWPPNQPLAPTLASLQSIQHSKDDFLKYKSDYVTSWLKSSKGILQILTTVCQALSRSWQSHAYLCFCLLPHSLLLIVTQPHWPPFSSQSQPPAGLMGLAPPTPFALSAFTFMHLYKTGSLLSFLVSVQTPFPQKHLPHDLR